MTAEEFKIARARMGLTQEALARRIGVTLSAVSKWEQGKRPVSNIAEKFIDSILKEAKDAREFVRFHQVDSKETELRTDESVSDILEEGKGGTV